MFEEDILKEIGKKVVGADSVSASKDWLLRRYAGIKLDNLDLHSCIEANFLNEYSILPNQKNLSLVYLLRDMVISYNAFLKTSYRKISNILLGTFMFDIVLFKEVRQWYSFNSEYISRIIMGDQISKTDFQRLVKELWLRDSIYRGGIADKHEGENSEERLKMWYKRWVSGNSWINSNSSSLGFKVSNEYKITNNVISKWLN